MEINIEQIVSDVKAAVKKVTKQDFSEIRGFQQNQVEALAQQAKIIAVGVAKGEISADMKEFFIDGLEAMTLNFVRTLKGLLEVTIEKVWNAVMKVLLGAIETIIKSLIPLPTQ